MPITTARTSPPCGGRIAAWAAGQRAKFRPKTASGPSVNTADNADRKKEPAPLNEMLIALPPACAFCDGACAAPLPPYLPRLAEEVRASASHLFRLTCHHRVPRRQRPSGPAER